MMKPTMMASSMMTPPMMMMVITLKRVRQTRLRGGIGDDDNEVNDESENNLEKNEINQTKNWKKTK